MSFLSNEELEKMKFKYIGKEVKISRYALFLNCEKIEIDDFSRIDPYSIISAGSEGVSIGKYVHIAAFCSIQGAGRVVLDDFSGLSSKVAIYSSSDDYSGKSMTNPCVPDEFKRIKSGPVVIGKHVIVGFNTCIMPNVKINIGSAVGAFSFVNSDVKESVIVSGVPAKEIKKRELDIFNLEKQLLDLK
jgi:acetyltransferase-like isoleucine patch superfamily enzyme